MGDETSQFASRFSAAVEHLGEVAGKRRARRGKGGGRAGGGDPAAGLSEALDAVEAVYQTGTGALRNWAEDRRQVLAQVGAMRRVLAADGAAATELAGMARELLALIESRRAGR